MKKLLAVLLAAALLLPGGALAQGTVFSDVPAEAWYAGQVDFLYQVGILPGTGTFRPMETATRLEFVRLLYMLHLALGGHDRPYAGPAVFTDMPPGRDGYQSVMWAYENAIAGGISPTLFDPDSPVTREQCCTLLIRFAAAEGLSLAKWGSSALFKDAGQVAGYARSYVAACRMASLVTGYADGTLGPGSSVLRCEAAAMIYRMYQAAAGTPAAGAKLVSLTPDAYLSLYERPQYDFTAQVPESEGVDPSWFDDAVFIGDSVTVRLQMYCASTKALGRATFLCTTSLSAPNALASVTAKSLHPTYNGVKRKVEDSVAACGAKNVYIMLGINNMRSSISSSTSSLVKLVERIKEKSPEVNIIIQSVTPMAATSTIVTDAINNRKINQYNARMKELCAENGWYYLNVAERFKDGSGNLISSYCSDPRSMGIHFTSAAAKLWCDYLKTHVPAPLNWVEPAPAPAAQPAPAVQPEPPKTVSLEEVRTAMLAGSTGEEPLLLDKSTLCQAYGLEESWVAQGAGFIIMSGIFPHEVLLVEAVDAAAAGEVADSLQYRLEEVTNQARLYDAQGYADIQKCAVVVNGPFVRLILSPEQDKFAEIYGRYVK